MFGKDGQIRVALADFTMCMQSQENAAGAVYAHFCPPHDNPSKGFDHVEGTGQLKERSTGLCLTASTQKSEHSPLSLSMSKCATAADGDQLQRWEFTTKETKPLADPV